MSRHGDCFDRCQAGGCGIECPMLQEGECSELDHDILLEVLIEASMSEDDKMEILEQYI